MTTSDARKRLAEKSADRGPGHAANCRFPDDGCLCGVDLFEHRALIAQAEKRGAVEALRDLAQTFRTDAAEAWGGGASWVTNGTSVAELAATWCLDRADHLADGGES